MEEQQQEKRAMPATPTRPLPRLLATQVLALLSGFDRSTQATECLAAAQLLYLRTVQPLQFWELVLPWFGAQQEALRKT